MRYKLIILLKMYVFVNMSIGKFRKEITRQKLAVWIMEIECLENSAVGYSTGEMHSVSVCTV